jgi:TetR/AcrR family transcriptional regulator, transcriptional repressor for nem operon
MAFAALCYDRRVKTARSPVARTSDTASRILDVAERLVQTRGFNGFSYADVAGELGVTKPSLHHHFASKAELGSALIARYSENFSAALQAIDRGTGDAFWKLKRYVKLYADVLTGERLCLCGMLAAEYATLPKPMQEQIRAFFDANEKWLAAVIEQGRKAKVLRPQASPIDAARHLLASLEGAMLVAWPYKDPARFACTARQALDELRAAALARRAERALS